MKHSIAPSLEEHGWELENAEDRHSQSPSFQIADVTERSSLRVGQRVQLLFLFNTECEAKTLIQCERMWVTIEGVYDGCYEGCLDSCPQTSDAVSPGDIISFRPEHISCILIPKTDPRHPDYAGDQ